MDSVPDETSIILLMQYPYKTKIPFLHILAINNARRLDRNRMNYYYICIYICALVHRERVSL